MESIILHEKCRMFLSRFEERLEMLKTGKGKQQFIEGVVFALDGCFREGGLGDLTPLQRENFIHSMFANTYSAAHIQNLDPETHMRKIAESHGKAVARSYLRALEIQLKLGIPVDFEEVSSVRQILMVADIETLEARKVSS